MLPSDLEMLIEALSKFQENFVSTSYSTMGFLLVISGWLITSSDAQGFLNKHKPLILLGIVFLILAMIGYAVGAFHIQRTSQDIFDYLKDVKSVEESWFKHYLLSIRGAAFFVGMQSLVLLWVIYVLYTIGYKENS